VGHCLKKKNPKRRTVLVVNARDFDCGKAGVMKYLWAIVLGMSLAAIGVSVTDWEYWAVFIPVTLAMGIKDWSEKS